MTITPEPRKVGKPGRIAIVTPDKKRRDYKARRIESVPAQRVEPPLPDVDRGWLYVPEQKLLLQKALITSLQQTTKGTSIKMACGASYRVKAASLGNFFNRYWSAAELWGGGHSPVSKASSEGPVPSGISENDPEKAVELIEG